VLDSVRDALRDHQREGNGRFRTNADLRIAGDDVPDLPGGTCLDHVAGQLVQEGRKLLAATLRIVELAADAADRLKPARRFVERRLGIVVAKLAPLHRQQRGNHLQVVRHAVLELTEQQLAGVRQAGVGLTGRNRVAVGALHPVHQRHLRRRDEGVESHCHLAAVPKPKAAQGRDEPVPGGGAREERR
jgi:hypothetical protein